MENRNSEELKHYGVLGMKWGVRRATKSLNTAKSSGDKERKKKALDSLSNHRSKMVKKIKKLDDRSVKLEKERYKSAVKGDTKAAKLEAKAAKLKLKSMKTWSDSKSYKLERKATKLSLKAAKLRYKSSDIKAKIEKNERLRNTFNQSLSEVNSTLIANGRKYVE